jgi:4-amino-4-deoxy-L-arabinose transferase-like glycosyltransferase
VAAALAATAVIMAVSGGFRTTVGGFRISARSPLPIAFLAFTNAAMWFMAARRARTIATDLESAWRFFERHSRIVVAIALSSAVVSAVFATHSAAGADASGYVSESAMMAGGRLSYGDELSDLARGHDPYLTSPLGWRPAADGRQSPTYPPGLPLVMALPHAIAGVTGASAVVIASAAIAVLATALVAFTLAGSIAAVIASVLLAFSPIFIYQSIQPMSDVPVTAAWMLCFLLLVRKGASLDAPAGVACALAVLIRPNLAPLAIVPLLLARNRIAFSIPVAIAGIGLALLQWHWYGSPLRSGYGSTDELFSLANILPNTSRYARWLLATAPVLLMAVFGFFRFRTDRRSQALLAFAALVIGAYLIYAVFDDWSYLRFLLPAMAVLAVFAAVELSAWIARWPIAVRAPLLFALLLIVTAHGLWVARSLDTFKLADQLRRVSQVADYINADVPPSAVILSGEQSGSMRYYTDRPILRWEAATPEALSAAVATLEQSRRPVYIVLDAWENERFRSKFSTVAAVSLDWPPMLDAGTSHRTRLWKLSDRDRFLKGERLSTIRLP